MADDAIYSLAVIVVSFNTRDQTLACIQSVISHSPAGTHIVVVDNGSADGSERAIRKQFPMVDVDQANENLGFARAVNRGVARTRATFVLLLNPDTLVQENSISSLVDFAREEPAYGIYGGQTLKRDGSVDPSSCWGAPSIWSLFCFATLLSTLFKRSQVFDPESLGRWARDTVRTVPIVTGCLLLMRRDNWQELGGMNELFFLYGEDAEFCIRAAQHGWRPVVVPKAVIIHDVGGSTSDHGNKMSMVMAGKVTLLRQIWSPRRAWFGVALLQAGVFLRALSERVVLRRGTWTTVWRRRADWLPGYPDAQAHLFGRR